MRGIFVDVPQFVLDRRRETGEDRFDEMWDGVLHMVPAPNRDHQELEFVLQMWLHTVWAPATGGKAHQQINLTYPGGWPNDFRIPDLALLMPDRFTIDRNEYCEGPPTAVVEIRSPGDETDDKLPFYANLCVPEVWIIDRDTKRAELLVLAGSEYETASPNSQGWLESRATGIEFRSRGDDTLLVRIAGDEATQTVLPED